MKEINTESSAVIFCDMIASLMEKGRYVGDWSWGDPAGQVEGLPTYELESKAGNKFWCTIVEYCNAGTCIQNRRGILATFPVDKPQSLGSVMATMIPYEFSRRFNTRAYCDEQNNYEIRNYGKVTVGRSAIKREYFFEYMKMNSPEKVLLDEEGKEYIVVYTYCRQLNFDQFCEQTYDITKLLSDFKKLYR